MWRGNVANIPGNAVEKLMVERGIRVKGRYMVVGYTLLRIDQ